MTAAVAAGRGTGQRRGLERARLLLLCDRLLDERVDGARSLVAQLELCDQLGRLRTQPLVLWPSERLIEVLRDLGTHDLLNTRHETVEPGRI